MSAAFSHSHSHLGTEDGTQAGGGHDNKDPQAESSGGDPGTSTEKPQGQEAQGEQAAVESTAKPRRPRGFAAMDRKLVSEIARKGGKAAHSAGTAHEFTTEEARVAGRKGGRATHAKRRARQEGTTEAQPRPPEGEERHH